MPPPIQYRDKHTGKVYTFDHEPTEQELNHAAGDDSAQPRGAPPAQRSMGESIGENFGLPMAGSIIGGKTPLGPIGSGIGAATGQAYGDLIDMFLHGPGNRTAGSEASSLAETAGLTALGEKIIPPVMNGIGKLRDLLPKGSGLLSGGGLGYFLGHPGYGAAAGAALDAAPQVGKAVEWMGTPAGKGAEAISGGLGAAERAALAKQGYTPDLIEKIAQRANQAGPGMPQRAGSRPPLSGSPLSQAFQDVPDYLQQQNWGNTIKSGIQSVADAGSNAVEGLKSGLKSGWDNLDSFMTKKEPAWYGTEVPYKAPPSIPAAQHYYDAVDMGMPKAKAVKVVSGADRKAVEALKVGGTAARSSRYQTTKRAIDEAANKNIAMNPEVTQAEWKLTPDEVLRASQSINQPVEDAVTKFSNLDIEALIKAFNATGK